MSMGGGGDMLKSMLDSGAAAGKSAKAKGEKAMRSEEFSQAPEAPPPRPKIKKIPVQSFDGRIEKSS